MLDLERREGAPFLLIEAGVEHQNMKWNYVDKDGNPKKAGRYWVTLIYPEMKQVSEDDTQEWEPTGKMLAEVTARDFTDLSKQPDIKSWIMKGQPESGLAWTEEVGSSQNETVWAWAEMEELPFPERLPEGVEKYRNPWK